MHTSNASTSLQSIVPESKMIAQGVEYEENDLFHVPSYLKGLSFELAGNIMYVVHGILFPEMGISDSNIESTLAEIKAAGADDLYQKYYLELSGKRTPLVSH